jgi:hypothetical protein
MQQMHQVRCAAVSVTTASSPLRDANVWDCVDAEAVMAPGALCG